MNRIGMMMRWHWHLVKCPFFLLCGVYGVQQLLLLFLTAGRQKMVGFQLGDLFMNCGQLPLFFIALYLVMIVSSAATRENGRSHIMYTLYTLPSSRWLLPTAQALLCFVLLVCFIAWQIILYILAFFPVTMLSNRTASGIVTGILPAITLPGEINANPLFQIMLPVRMTSWGWTVGFLLLLTVQSACVACCRGLRRLLAMVLSLITAGMGAGTLYLRYHMETHRTQEPMTLLLLGVMTGTVLLFAVLNLGSAIWALHRAENL